MIDKGQILERLKYVCDISCSTKEGIYQLINHIEEGFFDVKEKPLYSDQWNELKNSIENDVLDLKEQVSKKIESLKSDIKEIANFSAECAKEFNDINFELRKLRESVFGTSHMSINYEVQELRKELRRVEELVMDEGIKNMRLITIFGKIGEAINE